MFKMKYINKSVFTLFFFSLILSNNIFGQNNGPSAPEASSFEPIDATDMVSLLTGDLSYVLPLMSVPSPEGGYPIVLSYHAGIAMEQESSWAGLGWSINPGAINRSINGYPDDWKMANIKEIFYDQGGSETVYTLDLSYGVSTVVDVGLNLSWGSNKSLSGDVSLTAYGATIGTNGFGLSGSNASIGVNKDGGVNLRVSKGNGLGMSVGVDGSGNLSAGLSMNQKVSETSSKSIGVNFSSNSISINANEGGVGARYTAILNKAENSGRYSTTQTYSFFGINTPYGSVNYGKRKYEWHLDELTNSAICGTIYDKEYSQVDRVFEGNGGGAAPVSHLVKWDNYELYTENVSSINQENLITNHNNAFFPSTDGYSVNAQGLSGNMKPMSFNNDGISAFSYLAFLKPENTNTILVTDRTTLDSDRNINFQFINEHSSFLRVLPKKFVNNFNSTSINVINESDYLLGIDNTGIAEALPQNYFLTSDGEKVYYNDGNQISYDLSAKRLKKGNFVEFFTNKQIRENSISNFMEAKDLDRTQHFHSSHSDFIFPDDAIGAYRVTTPDGRVYHYSLPVYQFENIKRTYNIVAGKDEKLAHYDKIKETPYATHWLLTAITGPDYIKNNSNLNAYPNSENNYSDYGYWTRFDYGKWSDGYIWKTPYGKDYDISGANLKTYEWGRKQIYYLDAIKTRTHTAFFVKDIKEDAQSRAIQYQNKSHLQHSTLPKVNVPSTKLLKLNKIVLLKNEDAAAVSKNNSVNNLSVSEQSYYYAFSRHNFDGWYASQEGGVSPGFYNRNFKVNMQNNVLDVGDINTITLNKAIKSIDFNYDYSLASNVPYSSASGRLTLNNVVTKGKQNIMLVPPYKFEYITNVNSISNNFNIGMKDNWGYVMNAPMLWSLNKITTPLGGEIIIDYEADESVSTLPSTLSFTSAKVGGWFSNGFSITDTYGNSGINIGDKVNINYKKSIWDDGVRYDGLGTITSIISANTYGVTADGAFQSFDPIYGGNALTLNIDYIPLNPDAPVPGGGVRTSSITVSGDGSEVSKHYNYDIDGVSSGVTSFRPGAEDVIEKTPYISELPSPNVFYGNVEVQEKDKNGDLISKNIFEFETFSQKEEDEIKFGEMLEIQKGTIYDYSNTIAEKVTVKDFKSRIGRLNSSKFLNSDNQIISKTIYNYQEPSEFQQSFFQESYYSAKEVNFYNLPNKFYYLNSATRLIYPNVLKSTTLIQEGYTSIVGNEKFDFLTGKVLNETFEDSQGNKIKTVVKPAYTIPQYHTMGSKVENITNKNMLFQQTMSKSYIDVNGSWKEINAKITTWNNNWAYINEDESLDIPPSDGLGLALKIWRKHKMYIWDGEIDEDGFYQGYVGGDDNFNWEVGDYVQDPITGEMVLAVSQFNPKWKNIFTTTKYNHFSMPLEVKDLNNNYETTKMCDDNTKVSVSSNARYGEAFYSSAEYTNIGPFLNYLDQGIKGTVYRSSDYAHTGKYSLRMSSQTQRGFETVLKQGQHNSGNYKISVWVKKNNAHNARIHINGATKQFNGESITAGDWVLYNHYEELQENNETLFITTKSGVIYIDDFRIHPIVSNMTSYVYNKWDELSYIIGANNLATHFIYDSQGRLIETQKEVVDTSVLSGGFKKVGENFYNYKNQ